MMVVKIDIFSKILILEYLCIKILYSSQNIFEVNGIDKNLNELKTNILESKFFSKILSEDKNLNKILFQSVRNNKINFVFLYTTPKEAMVGEIEIGYIAGQYIFGAAGSIIFALGISILLVSTVSSNVYIGPRIMQTMGQD